MWFVEGTINGIKFSKLIYVRTKRDDKDNSKTIMQPFVIGRREGDLIYSSDRRVSRIHAQINIELDPNQRPKLFITDLSKFGTKINDKEMNKKTRHQIYENDKVCVGISSSTFTIKWLQFVALFSRIPLEQRKAIKTLIIKMGGTISTDNDWNNTITHLIIPNNDLPITAKVIEAIIHEKEIITMEWLKYLFKNGTIPTKDTCYIPSNLLNWLTIGKENYTKYGIKRSHLFKQKLFVFINDKLLKNNEKIITDCSGHVMLIHKAQNMRKEIQNAMKDNDAFAIFDDSEHGDDIDGFKYFNTYCIANSILSCDINGSQNEIKWINIENIRSKKRKRSEIMDEPVSQEEAPQSPPKKKHKALIAMKQSKSVISPRKLNCAQFTSIKRLKSSFVASESSTRYTSSICRNLNILSVKKNKEHKKLEFNDVSGRKKLKNDFKKDDDYYDEDNLLKKQKELYSEENICKLQREVVEMDIIVKSPHKSPHKESVESQGLKQPNFKAFKGNPNYLKAIQTKIKNMVEFDDDFKNKDEYDHEFNDKHFRKQRQKEEKQEKEIDNLFGSKQRAKKAISPKNKNKNKKAKQTKKRKRKEIENGNESMVKRLIKRRRRK